MKHGFFGGLFSKLRGKLSRRGGFTMMEMLIAVAIIAVMTSIGAQTAVVRDVYNAVADANGVQGTSASTPNEANADVYAAQAAPTCAHDWGPTQYEWSKDYTKCTAVSVCRKCEMKDKVSATHIEKKLEEKCEEPGSATYTATFKKASLGNSVTVEIPMSGHDWGEATVVTEPTCTRVGLKTRTCQRAGCGATGIVVTPELGHLWGYWVDTSTCTQPGNMKRTCQRPGCGETQTADAPALGHDWGEWAVTTEPTCTQFGVKTRACQRPGCGETQTADAPALGHDWGAATYTWSADHGRCAAERACGRCGLGESATVNSLAEGIPATCTEDGKTTYTAAFAAPFETQTKTVNVPKLGHDWGAATYKWSHDYSYCKATRVCKRSGCSQSGTQTVNVTVGADTATCEAAGTITYTATFEAPFETQTVSVDTPALGHTGGDAATCQQLAVCTRCGKEYGELAEHTPGKKMYRETEAGAAWTIKCTVCGEVIDTGVIPWDDPETENIPNEDWEKPDESPEGEEVQGEE